MKPRSILRAVFCGVFAFARAVAQQPDVLQHTLFSPSPAPQTNTQEGYSVAIDGDFVVAGAAYDSIGGHAAGVIKVYDRVSGALLHVLANPSPAPSDQFGWTVAVSGTLVVVGAPWDDTGAPNAGSAYVYDLASEVPTMPVMTLNNPTPRENGQFGISVAISGTRVVVGGFTDAIGAINAGSAYVYDFASTMPTMPVVKLKNPNSATYDSFGWSVAVNGNRVVVGARTADTGATDAGSAHVYDLASAMPTISVLTLNNPSPAVDDRFGTSVAVSGTRVVVGAYRDDMGAINAGSAYVYDLAGATPTVPVATLNNPSPASEERFGRSVAVSGTRVVVGSEGDDTGALNAGSTYVYDLASTTPTVPMVTLNNPSPGAGDWFGWSVAVNGTRVVVGAPTDDSSASAAGSVYVYELASATPTVPVATLNSPSPAAGDFFGCSVAVSGTRLVVGAYNEYPGANHVGTVYVYDLASATPSMPVVTLTKPSPAVSDSFGASVAVSGTRVVVGAYGDDTGFKAGSAHVYDLASANPTIPVATLNNPSPAVDDRFGMSVAVSGTLVVVGAERDDTGATDAGSAYVYDLASATPALPVAKLNKPSPAVSDAFGRSVAVSGTRVVVGAPSDDTGAIHAGSAYIYDLAGATPTVPVATLNNPSPAVADSFGKSVAVSGSRIVVGAFWDDTGATDAGSAYVYDLASATPTLPVATLNNPSPAVEDRFGYSVAVSGTRVVVLAPLDDTGEANAGSVYVYDLASATPTIPVATLSNPSPAEYDLFDGSIALSGSRVVIGASRDGSYVAGKGAVYIFGSSADTDNDSFADLEEDLNRNNNHADDDTDRDGIPNYLDADDDGDGVLTANEDTNGNGDWTDDDSDADGIPDHLDNYPDPVATVLFSKGDEVPGSGIPADSVWKTFGVPSIINGGASAFKAATASPTGSLSSIFRQSPGDPPEVVAQAKEPARGAGDGVLFASFKDPLLNGRGDIAFVANLSGAGVTSANNQALFVYSTDSDSDAVVARKGSLAPGVQPGARWKNFNSVAFARESTLGGAWTLAISASLVTGPQGTAGPGGVTKANDTGLWLAENLRIELALQEGQTLTVGGAPKTVKSFHALKPLPGLAGQGHGASERGVPVRVIFTDGTQALLRVRFPDGTIPGVEIETIALPGDPIPGLDAPIKRFGLSTQSSSGDTTVWIASLDSRVNAQAIVCADSAGVLSSVARKGDPLFTAANSPRFLGFTSVAVNEEEAYAVLARRTGAGVTRANDLVLAVRAASLDWDIIAHEGARPPGTPEGAQWATFPSYAIADGSAAVAFLGKLRVPRVGEANPARVTTANDIGLWVALPGEEPRLLLREGDPLGSKTVRNFDALTAISGSPAQRRTFTADGRALLIRVVATDGSQHLLHIALPEVPMAN